MKDKNIVEERMKQFNEDINHWENYDFVVINDNIDRCYKEIIEFINKKIEKSDHTFDKKNIQNHIECHKPASYKKKIILNLIYIYIYIIYNLDSISLP